MVLLLTRDDVVSVLDMRDCMDAMGNAFLELANGSAVLPLRVGISPPGGVALYMPAYLKTMNALACKVVTVYRDNPRKHSLPTTIGKVLLQNPETGEVICIMDGGYLTAVRTGAVSGLATQHLARKGEGQIAAVFGAGVQARMQLWGVCEARKISRAMVFDVAPGAATTFAAEMTEKLHVPIEVAENPEALLGADIICTATSSASPIFDGTKVKAGTHINGIGSHSPSARELDTAVVRRSLFVADSREACLKEAGDLMIPIQEGAITAQHVYAELGEIVAGSKPGRTDDRQITIFKSNGLAIQDVAAAKLVYDRAKAKGIGAHVEF